MKTKIICLKILLVLSVLFSSAQARNMREFRFALDQYDFVKENHVVVYFREINPQHYSFPLCKSADDPKSQFAQSVDPWFKPPREPRSILLLQTIPNFSETKKLMFDDFCEEEFLSNQARDLLLVNSVGIRSNLGTRSILFNINSEETRLKLINNAIDFAKKNQISLGKKLTDEQMELLTENIIWLVEEEIKFSDNKSIKALVPYIYAVWPNKGKLVVCEVSKSNDLYCDYGRMSDWLKAHKEQKRKICKCYRDSSEPNSYITHFWKLTDDEARKFGSSYSSGNDTFGDIIEVENESTCINKCCYDANGSMYSVDDIEKIMVNCPKSNKVDL